jgi:2',3'-cyclic-nucleotide 2'-phosphodiesterase (5'-nucleotidase family)
MKGILKLALTLGLVLALAGCASTAGAPAAASAAALANDVKITIIHTNDVHARAVESKTEIGYSRIAALAADARKANPTLVIDAGDAFHGLPFANLEQGASIVKLMNAAGYDYMTTGNHDYNYGQARLLELEKQAKFKILVANVYKDGKRLFPAYDIKDLGGVRVAVFGLATPETAYKTDPKGIEGITFADPIAEAKKVAAELKGKYDVLVCVSHLGIDKSSDVRSNMVADAVPEIDVVIDGHSHSSLSSEALANDSGALIAQADSSGTSVGVVDLVVGKNRKVASRTARTITLVTNPTLASDPAVKAVADEITAAQAPMLAVKVGATAVALEGKREIVRTQESNLGKLIANGMRYATGADFAFINGGGIRDSIPAGDITKKSIFTIQPFGNLVWTTVVKGSEIDAILENGVGKLPAADGRFPHWANLTYALDATKPAGDRASDIKIGGVPVDANKNYTLALLNFEFNGGDEYKMFAGKAYKEFPSDAEITMAYIQKLGTVTADNIEMK